MSNLATNLATKLATDLASDLANLTVAAQFAALFSGYADAVFLESDNYNSGAGTWTDKLDPAHVMTATGTIASPASSARFVGNPMLLTGTQWLVSNRAATRFKSMHLKYSVIEVYAPTSLAGNDIAYATWPGAGAVPGAYAYGILAGTGNVDVVVRNASAAAFDSGVVAAGNAVGTVTVLQSYGDVANSPNATAYNKTTQLASGALSSPSSLDPLQTLVIGSFTVAGSNQLHAELRAFYYLPYALSASQRAIALSYIAAL